MWDNPVCKSRGAGHEHGKEHHVPGHCHCPGTGLSRFLQPCLLMLLTEGHSHGYDLIERLPGVGYLDSSPDPATVYKVLRRLEAEGAVKSQWDTSGTGPAKRIYSITRDGEDVLGAWAASLRKNKESVEKFLKVFRQKFGK